MHFKNIFSKCFFCSTAVCFQIAFLAQRQYVFQSAFLAKRPFRHKIAYSILTSISIIYPYNQSLFAKLSLFLKCLFSSLWPLKVAMFLLILHHTYLVSSYFHHLVLVFNCSSLLGKVKRKTFLLWLLFFFLLNKQWTYEHIQSLLLNTHKKTENIHRIKH